MSLVAAELERRGIATAALVLLREIARRVRPPRVLWVPYRHGYPLGRPGEPETQRAVLEAALKLFESRRSERPVLVDYVADSA